MVITLVCSGCTVTCNELNDLDEACEALTRAVAHVRGLATLDPSPVSRARPVLNEVGRAVVDYLHANPTATFAQTVQAGHPKKAIDWLCKQRYLQFDAKTQLLTVA